MHSFWIVSGGASIIHEEGSSMLFCEAISRSGAGAAPSAPNQNKPPSTTESIGCAYSARRERWAGGRAAAEIKLGGDAPPQPAGHRGREATVARRRTATARATDFGGLSSRRRRPTPSPRPWCASERSTSNFRFVHRRRFGCQPTASRAHASAGRVRLWVRLSTPLPPAPRRAPRARAMHHRGTARARVRRAGTAYNVAKRVCTKEEHL